MAARKRLEIQPNSCNVGLVHPVLPFVYSGFPIPEYGPCVAVGTPFDMVEPWSQELPLGFPEEACAVESPCAHLLVHSKKGKRVTYVAQHGPALAQR